MQAVTAAGYRWATLDLAGLRSGGFNQLLSVGARHQLPGRERDVGHAEVLHETALGPQLVEAAPRALGPAPAMGT